MKKNQNGVTLIALAVTIIVMLILAGATMSMLTGNSGIMTNAKKSSAASEEADAYEKMAQAFSTVQLSVESEAALNGGYNAQDKITDYVEMAKKEIGASQVEVVTKELGEGIAQNEKSYETHNKKFIIWPDTDRINIIYCSKTFALKPVDKANDSASTKNQYPMLKAAIIFDDNIVTYMKPVTSVTDSYTSRSTSD